MARSDKAEPTFGPTAGFFPSRLALLLAGAILSAAPAQAPPPSPLAITGITVLDPGDGTARRGVTVVIRDGRVAAITPAGEMAPVDAISVDGSGRFLIPAFTDAHVHLTTQPEATAPRDVLLPSLVVHGVLAVRDMGGDFDRVQELRRAIAAGGVAGPHILTPGPFIDGPQPPSPTVEPVATAQEAASVVLRLTRRGVDFLKVQAGLSPDAWAAVLQAAAAGRIAVHGHVPESASAFDVVRGGQRTVEHVSPALPGDAAALIAVSRDETAIRAEMTAITQEASRPNGDGDALRVRQRALQRRIVDTTDGGRRAELFAAMRERGVVLVPTLVWSGGLLPQAADDRGVSLDLLPRAARESFERRRAAELAQGTSEIFALHRHIAARSRAFAAAAQRAGVLVAAGTDAFDSFLPLGDSLHREMEELVEGGMSPRAALAAATQVPAALHRSWADRGAVRVGAIADLVLLDGNPLEDIRNTRRIRAVVRGGRLLDRDVLDRLLVEVRQAAAR